MELTEHAQHIQELDVDLMLQTLDYIKIYESGVVVTTFLDGTEIEYRKKCLIIDTKKSNYVELAVV